MSTSNQHEVTPRAAGHEVQRQEATSSSDGGRSDLKASLRGKSFAEQEGALRPASAGGAAPDVQREAKPGAPVQRVDTPRVDGEAVPADIRTKLVTDLNKVARTKDLLAAITLARGNADFPLKWSDSGTFHSEGIVYLDTGSSESGWFADLAHELVHLQTFLEGKAADAEKMGREQFVKAKMDDEINAQVSAYIALLQAAKTTDAGTAGFDEFATLIADKHAALLTAKSWGEIDVIARAWITDKYKSGGWTTNNTNENYYDYWGNYWDEVNAP